MIVFIFFIVLFFYILFLLLICRVYAGYRKKKMQKDF